MNADDAEEYTAALGQVVAGGYRQVALGARLGVPQALGLTVGDWVEQRLGGYVRLSLPERQAAVAELIADGMNQRQTAEILGVHESTVSRDLAPASEEARDQDTDAADLADASASPDPAAFEQLGDEAAEIPAYDGPEPDLTPPPNATLTGAADIAAGPRQPTEPPQWARIRNEGHDMTNLARRLIASADDMPKASDAAFVAVSLAACRQSVQAIRDASDAWIAALNEAQPVTTQRLRSVSHA